MASVDFLLASNSPRRRQLFGLTGWTFLAHATELDETARAGEDSAQYVLRLAGEKARAAAKIIPSGAFVFGSDTAVVDGAEILGKPANAADARRMLRQLRGRTHMVLTGLAIYQPETRRLVVDLCTARVKMRAYSDDEIEAYILSGDPMDKAGAYAIQHAGFQPVIDFTDCYACVMGLPLCHLDWMMRSAFERTPPADVPLACQAGLGYPCPVFSQIISGSAGHAFAEV